MKHSIYLAVLALLSNLNDASSFAQPGAQLYKYLIFTASYDDGHINTEQRFKIALDDQFYKAIGFHSGLENKASLFCKTDDGGPYRPSIDITLSNNSTLQLPEQARMSVSFFNRSTLNQSGNVSDYFSDQSAASVSFKDLKDIDFSGIKNTGTNPHLVQALRVKYEEYIVPLSSDSANSSNSALTVQINRNGKGTLVDADSQDGLNVKLNCSVTNY